MKKALSFIKSKLAFLIAIASASAIGGATTAMVIASIPDSNGVVHTCYSTTRGTLYVIDNSSQSCGTGESSLTLNQAPSYAFIRYDGTTASIDTNVPNRGVSIVSSTGNVSDVVCLDISGNPSLVQATPSTISGVSSGLATQIRGYYQSSSSSSNTSDFDNACQSGANVAIYNNSTNTDLFVGAQ